MKTKVIIIALFLAIIFNATAQYADDFEEDFDWATTQEFEDESLHAGTLTKDLLKSLLKGPSFQKELKKARSKIDEINRKLKKNYNIVPIKPKQVPDVLKDPLTIFMNNLRKVKSAAATLGFDRDELLRAVTDRKDFLKKILKLISSHNDNMINTIHAINRGLMSAAATQGFDEDEEYYSEF